MKTVLMVAMWGGVAALCAGLGTNAGFAQEGMVPDIRPGPEATGIGPTPGVGSYGSTLSPTATWGGLSNLQPAPTLQTQPERAAPAAQEMRATSAGSPPPLPAEEMRADGDCKASEIHCALWYCHPPAASGQSYYRCVSTLCEPQEHDCLDELVRDLTNR